MRFFQQFGLMLLCYGVTCSTPAMAWGERGHQLIAVVAARLCEHDLGDKSPLTKVLRDKELMLGHLANVPDIVWRSIDKASAQANFTTHYVGIDLFASPPTLADMPRTIAAMEAKLKDYCASHAEDTEHCAAASSSAPATNNTQGDPPAKTPAERVGTAPFRIAQLYVNTVAAFKSIKAGASKKEVDDAVNLALINAGIMAHFVGDLGQPLHATVDYDGYGSGEGGLHSYFESDVVSAMDLFLVQDVYAEALQSGDFANLQKAARIALAAKTAKHDERQMPIVYAEALAVDSWQHIANLEKLDRQFAVKKLGSSAHGLRLPAQRWPAAKVAGDFHVFAVQRLALAAKTLAYLWLSAWHAGGEPNLSSYQSYVYPVAPAFIVPDYLDKG